MARIRIDAVDARATVELEHFVGLELNIRRQGMLRKKAGQLDADEQEHGELHEHDKSAGQ